MWNNTPVLSVGGSSEDRMISLLSPPPPPTPSIQLRVTQDLKVYTSSFLHGPLVSTVGTHRIKTSVN